MLGEFWWKNLKRPLRKPRQRHRDNIKQKGRGSGLDISGYILILDIS
jgi:hypothetical protein